MRRPLPGPAQHGCGSCFWKPDRNSRRWSLGLADDLDLIDDPAPLMKPPAACVWGRRRVYVPEGVAIRRPPGAGL